MQRRKTLSNMSVTRFRNFCCCAADADAQMLQGRFKRMLRPKPKKLLPAMRMHCVAVVFRRRFFHPELR